jgi:hypothetical protein
LDLKAKLKETNNKSKSSKIKIVEPNESVIVGKVECIEEEGEKGELYAITKNDKVVLYKKNSIKKV